MRQRNAFSLISRIREKGNKFIVSELKRQGVEGIVSSHGDILSVLFEGEKFTMKELADKIHRTRPTVTVLVEKLVNYGFVKKEKSHTDCRVTYVKLTKKGVELKPVFYDISYKLNSLIYGDFTNEEIEIFEKLLKKIKLRMDDKVEI